MLNEIIKHIRETIDENIVCITIIYFFERVVLNTKFSRVW